MDLRPKFARPAKVVLTLYASKRLVRHGKIENLIVEAGRNWYEVLGDLGLQFTPEDFMFMSTQPHKRQPRRYAELHETVGAFVSKFKYRRPKYAVRLCGPQLPCSSGSDTNVTPHGPSAPSPSERCASTSGEPSGHDSIKINDAPDTIFPPVASSSSSYQSTHDGTNGNAQPSNSGSSGTEKRITEKISLKGIGRMVVKEETSSSDDDTSSSDYIVSRKDYLLNWRNPLNVVSTVKDQNSEETSQPARVSTKRKIREDQECEMIDLVDDPNDEHVLILDTRINENQADSTGTMEQDNDDAIGEAHGRTSDEASNDLNGEVEDDTDIGGWRGSNSHYGHYIGMESVRTTDTEMELELQNDGIPMEAISHLVKQKMDQFDNRYMLKVRDELTKLEHKSGRWLKYYSYAPLTGKLLEELFLKLK